MRWDVEKQGAHLDKSRKMMTDGLLWKTLAEAPMCLGLLKAEREQH